MRISKLFLTTALALLPHVAGAGEGSANAKPVDPHALYEAKCASCHAKHASALAQQKLRLSGDKTAETKAGVAVSKLLVNHRGTKLDEAEIGALADQFAWMLSTGFVFQKKCAGCHDKGLSFARLYLELRDGEVMSRLHGEPVAKLLETHARLDQTQTRVILDMLRRQLETKP